MEKRNSLVQGMSIIDNAKAEDEEEEEEDDVEEQKVSEFTVLSIAEKQVEGAVAILQNHRRKTFNVSNGFEIIGDHGKVHLRMDVTPDRLENHFKRFFGDRWNDYCDRVEQKSLRIFELGGLTLLLRKEGTEMEVQLHSAAEMDKVCICMIMFNMFALLPIILYCCAFYGIFFIGTPA